MSDYDKRRQLEELACEMVELEKRLKTVQIEIAALLTNNVGNEFVKIDWTALRSWSRPAGSE